MTQLYFSYTQPYSLRFNDHPFEGVLGDDPVEVPVDEVPVLASCSVGVVLPAVHRCAKRERLLLLQHLGHSNAVQHALKLKLVCKRSRP